LITELRRAIVAQDNKRKNNYQIKAVKDVIRMKEARGADASFERNLLKEWSKYPGWENAKL